jgi:hypothetical protein
MHLPAVSLNKRRVNKLGANTGEQSAASVPSGRSCLETVQNVLANRNWIAGDVKMNV